MNIVCGFARGGSPCVLALPGLPAKEQMLWQRSTYEYGTWHINVHCWGNPMYIIRLLSAYKDWTGLDFFYV